MNNLVATFKEHLEKNFSELLDTPFLIACSGGVDSMVLVSLCQQLSLNFGIAHCNFELRAEESDGDERFVQETAHLLQIPLFQNRFDTTKEAKTRKKSIQVTARELRYQWFKELIATQNFEFVLTAHHLDDVLETYLINLSRSTGIEGLTGIPERNKHIVRPLLLFSREQLLSYALQEEISWREDSSNQGIKYLRNQLRHSVIPALKGTNQNFLQNFKHTIDFLSESQDFIRCQIDAISKQIIRKTSDNEFEILIEKLKVYPNPSFILYQLLKDYNFTAWKDINRLLTAESGKFVTSPTHQISKHRKVLIVAPTNLEIANSTAFYPITESDTTVCFPGGMLKMTQVKEYTKASINEIYIDQERLSFPLRIRKKEEGDYFYPLGLGGKKKISKFFRDEKLSLPEKEKVWILSSGDKVVWIINHRADERFKVKSNTNKIVKIVFYE
ncbi:tRNA lysidine(34) synthetase TilS [Aquimarina sp. ERC-38]|uniref:tRNA lysidine(34) synthetase TilS n=1 Tax=Aquimarina sp. ERC-38 TaxID=2949996 RepID=UPI002246AAD9|nr:tRNA lysidine(34) synthetase TilS [Aquimarina sp. ERC-38]UZO80018.1 tRNA lysidine(34) synthetase TilS [Aquimarina sp. ERC-38]